METLFSFSAFEEPIIDFLKTTRTSAKWYRDRGRITSDLRALFAEVPSFESINEQLFWSQINTIRRRYSNDRDKRVNSLQGIVSFYVYIIKKHPELELFNDARTLYPSLLENRLFVTEWLENNCTFMTFKPGILYDSHEQYIFILRGAEHTSSKLRSTDYKRVDLSTINSNFYRRCVFDYVCSAVNNLNNFTPSFYSYSLNFLSELKKTNGYINKHEDCILSTEIQSLKTALEARLKQNSENIDNPKTKVNLSIRTYVYTIKGFFTWCINNHRLNVDDTFFDQFKVFNERAYVPKTKRPEAETLDILLNASREKAEQDPDHYFVFDTILRLILTTKIRISSICGLKRDSIKEQLKPGTYRINYITKTSYSDKNDSTTITALDKQRLDKMMAFNEKLIELAPKELKNSIFLYIPYRKKYVREVDEFSFRLYLIKIYEENKISKVTATQLRKEYMSQARSHAIKEKLDDVELKSLTGHSHVETTDKHYVSVRLEDYFEEMYKVSLQGHKNVEKEKIVEQVPDNLERVGDITHKCGACNAAKCLTSNALPCFLCKDFITSIEFLPIFKRMVDELDNSIISSPNKHDKEDWVAIKEVLVTYIVELTRKL